MSHYSAVMVRSNGTVWAWGYHQEGLGNGTTQSPVPVQVSGFGGVGALTGAISVSTNSSHTLALLSDGTVAAWGNNTYGALGDGTWGDPKNGVRINQPYPVHVKGADGTGYLSNVVAVAAGAAFSVALTADGRVYTWGYGWDGQLGIGVYGAYWYGPVKTLPTLVTLQGGAPLPPITAISAGPRHVLALASDGSVYAWGGNTWGTNPAATGCGASSAFPCRVLGVGGDGYLAGVAAVSAGANLSVALKADGSVVTWGENAYGQLGIGSTSPTYSLYPVSVVGLPAGGVTDLAAERFSVVARTHAGQVFVWGDLSWGSSIPTPSQIAAFDGLAAVFGGPEGRGGFALSGDGDLYGFGANNYGVTGISGPSVVYAPVTGISRLP